MTERALPPGLTILPPPAHLRLRETDHGGRFRWREAYTDDSDDDVHRYHPLAEATEFPAPVTTADPDALRAKLFACSGGIDSTRYMEATRFRAMPDMTWPEACAALNRLRVPVTDYRHHATTAEYVALAEFALTAHGFTGFAGLRGDNGVKLRKEIADVILLYLRKKLDDVLHTAERFAGTIARPITNRLHSEDWRGNRALWAMVPIDADRWTQLIEASPDQAIAALDHLRTVHATWQTRRADADTVNDRMIHGSTNLPTAAEFAEALHVADMLAFTGEKLSILYAAIMHSMPIYRLYPATAEAEAFALWWPWGRPPPLIDGGPPQPPKPRKATIDPATITATRPHEVVREVMEKAGIESHHGATADRGHASRHAGGPAPQGRENAARGRDQG